MATRDLTNQNFNFLHIIELDHVKETKSAKRKIWKCQCRCGKIVYLPTYKITSGSTKSCGCIKNDFTHKAEYTNSPNPEMKGIYFEEESQKYRVRFHRNKKPYHLGRYDDFKDAKSMRMIADTFTSFDNFMKWYENKYNIFTITKDLCEKYNVDLLIVTEQIYNGYMEHLYFNMNDLKNFIKDFADTINQ